MNKIFFYLIVTVITVLFSACNKSVECPNEKIVMGARETDVIKVKAIIWYIQHPDDKCRSMYEVASVKYVSGEFELNELYFPAIIQDEYLSLFSEKEVNIVSDIKAKTVAININAYNSAGNNIGSFSLSNDYGSWSAFYVYADRNFIKKGNVEYSTNHVVEFDCIYEEGWNVVYVNYGKIIKNTTQKPLSVEFKWHFSGYYHE